MKNIVVGIDFSKNSINALKHAIAIAIKSGGKLHLVWVKTPGTTESIVKDNVDNYTMKAEEHLNELVNECKSEAPECEVHSVILEGKAPTQITTFASNLKDAVIVIGTHGISGFEEVFVGTNAFKIVSMSKVPVLMLREGIQINRDLTQILVPIDTSFETLQKMKDSITFAKAFNAKIFLLGLVSPILSEVKHVINIQLRHAGAMCEKANVRYDAASIEVNGVSSKTIIDFANSMDVNLMVIMREEEEDLSSFWMGSTTRQLVNNTPMPILIIPNVNHFAINK